MIELLGFEIFDGSKSQYMTYLMEKYKNGKKTVLISGNPEVLYNAIENDEMKSICKKADIIPDGVGVIVAGKITGQHFKQKIAGIEIMEEILKLSNTNNISVFMLGAEYWVVEKAVNICKHRYNTMIAGFHDGYFNMDDCMNIIDDINKSGADALLVAMGCPKQELFIAKYKDILNPKILMGVGGSFDVLAGKVQRAPKWMINLGLEWLYRVAKEPWRIKRLTSIPKFLVKVVLNSKKS